MLNKKQNKKSIEENAVYGDFLDQLVEIRAVFNKGLRPRAPGIRSPYIDERSQKPFSYILGSH